MSKKNFKDNPALQFISTPAPAAESAKETPDQAPAQPRSKEKPPEGYKINPLYVEVKTRRLQLVLQPSLYDRVKAGAQKRGLSVNEYVHQILDHATTEE